MHRIQREGEVAHLVAQQLFDLTADLSGLADWDAAFKLRAGRGDEFAHGDRPVRVMRQNQLSSRVTCLCAICISTR